MENLSGLGQAKDQAKMEAMRINPDLLDSKLFPFATSSRVMGWSMCNLFYSLICIYPRVLITNANRVCILGLCNDIFTDKAIFRRVLK